MISLTNVVMTFGNRPALNGPAAHFEHGMVHGIVGLNGAGKTTFFNILSGFLRPDSGAILNNGQPLRRKELAYLEAVNFFYSDLTGEEYLSIFPCTNRDFNSARMNELMPLPLKDLIETYSTGMKKKLAFLSVLKQDAQIYLLDEPFNGLDLETSEILKLVVQHLHGKGKTIFISSHILAPLLALCDKIHLLQGGVFVRAYDRHLFDTIEADLFANFDRRIQQILDLSL